MASVWPFQLLLAVLLVRLISIPASLLLVVVFERTPETSIALSLAFAVNLGLNLLLIPSHGINGAIEASFAGFALATAYMWLALWRVARLRIGSRHLLLLLAVSVVWLAATAAERHGRLSGQLYWGSQALLCAGLVLGVWQRWRSPVLAGLRGARP
jgi:O-antigen/teichoic acid export membrane protein